MTPTEIIMKFFKDCEESHLRPEEIGMTISVILSSFCYDCAAHDKLDAAVAIQAIAVDAVECLKTIETRH